ncbi:hypothetical protein K491DRAFT_722389 [Lophiostoma macrostomum CBS 122681]|uniref:Rhodopsin domain-containing protein n=1 Tax=Lophiostoma macrostomum CBS 122681 TaxID=1314788 RepID=A0A6A6SR84_9PLEO|nr:hypothetical protein K491DRAFT_722389 [Lophiostoma macrostomum CBS 122681]
MESQFQDLPPEYLAENKSGALLGTCIAFLFIDTITISLLYISRCLGKDYKAKRWMTLLMTAGFCVTVGKITLGILMVRIGGAGRHLASLDMPTMTNTLKLQLGLQLVCPLTTSLAKLGILALYQELFGRASKTYQNVIKVTFLLVFCIMIVQIIIPFANCKPFSYNWNLSLPEGSCAFSGLHLWRYLSIPNVVTTIIMILIPLPVLYNLKVDAATRVGFCLVFTVALVGMIAAIMRFVSFMLVANFDDITYECIRPFCWTIAESGIYLVAGVLPTLKPLIKRMFGNVDFGHLLSGKTSQSWRVKMGSNTPQKESLPQVHIADGAEASEKVSVEADTESVKSGHAISRVVTNDADEETLISTIER